MVRLRVSWPFSLSSAPTVGNPCRPLQPEPVSLLSNVRWFKATSLPAVPSRYRHDALDFWDALGRALSRYLGGLALVLVIQGILSATALFLIGVPYPLALGAWVSITAVIPYLGAWLGAIPALLVAFSISPGTAALTAILFL